MPLSAGWNWSAKSRTYPGTATEAAFLLGGIGTGNVSLGARGNLRDWELCNKPGKGTWFCNTYFAIWACPEGQAPVTRLLESRLSPPFGESHGMEPRTGGGLPRLDASIMHGEYPLAGIEFQDATLPVQVSLEAYTPFIPLQAEDSGLPCAILRYRVRNTQSVPVAVTLAGSLMNPLGMEQISPWRRPAGELLGQHVNVVREAAGLRGVFFTSDKIPTDHLQFGNLCLATTHDQVTIKRNWVRGEWWDEVQDFWDDFAADGRFSDPGYDSPSADGKYDTASVGAYDTLLPGEERAFTFMLTWYFPNRPRGWGNVADGAVSPIVRNHYATRFASAWDVAAYLAEHQARLERETVAFHAAFFASSLPAEVLDAAAANITVLRSPTCFWLEDGAFMGWEGCHDGEGCCHGSCTHVWNYTQTLAFLFPSLERSMRAIEFGADTAADGKMNFRVGKVFSPLYEWDFLAAADGQLGCVMRLYRDWKLSGDGEFLASLWEAAKRSLTYACHLWDTDQDLVLDGRQHNTYDIEFYGPNPLTGLFLVGALRAAAEMAEAMAEPETAGRYREAAGLASERLDAFTWNGEYYCQRLSDIDQHKYQYGQGCLTDQLLAQTGAHLYGLGYLLPQARVRSAIQSVFRYNFKTQFADHVNTQRAYAFNDEQGLLLCTWPAGGRPRFPFPYSDEVWTGIEYQVATHLIYEGLLDEALTIVRAVRDRHDGVRRNPWNEVECGHHYARSMASWGLVIALSGFRYDMVSAEMSFAPVVGGDACQCFWSTGRGWGSYRQSRDPHSGELIPQVQVLGGDMSGVRVRACGREWLL